MSMIVKEFDLDNVFMLSEIIDKMGLTVKTDKIAGKVKTTKLEDVKDATTIGKEVIVAVGADLAVDFVKNIYKARPQVCKFIADLTDMEVKDVKKMGLKKLKTFFVELVGQEDFRNFFE